MRKVTITLGEQSFEIGRLTVGQLRELDGEMVEGPPANSSAKDLEQFFFDQGVRIIAIGIARVDPSMTVEKVLAIEVDGMNQILDARTQILRHAGLMVDKKTPVGKSEAEVPTTGGNSSTAG